MGASDDLLRRFTESAGTQDRVPVPTPPFHSWFAERREADSYRVTRVPFGDLSRGRLQPETGILVKEFNGVLHCLMTQLSPALQGTRSWLTLAQLRELLHVDNLVTTDARTVLSGIPFAAPVDRGLLAFLAKRVGDVLHVLVQARTQAGASVTRRTATRSSRSATTSRSRFRRTSSG